MLSIKSIWMKKKLPWLKDEKAWGQRQKYTEGLAGLNLDEVLGNILESPH